MKNYLLATLAFLLYTINIFPQAEGLKEVYDDAEYFFYSESYNDALINYLKIYRRGYQTNANINFKIGYCYLHTADKLKAQQYLEEAIKNTSIKFKEGSLKEDKAPIESFMYLGNAYRITGNLDKAIESYDNYLKQVPPGKPTDEVNYTKKQVEACKTAVELQKNPIKYTVEVLENSINNSSANFNPIVTPSESVLAYVSRLRFYDAILVSRKVKDKWSAPENITPQIQSDGNQYTSSFSSDGNTMYLTKEDNYDSDIYFSKFDGKTWSKSMPLNKNINSKYWESHASVTGDGKTMYFASNRKGGKGGMDIYVSEMGATDWNVATILNTTVNSDLDDDYPFISEDGKTLYFCSQGHKTMGGFDVFYSVKNGDSWSEPVNIGYPINTTDDDIFFCPVKNGTVAYQAIYPKTGGMGDLDIVRYEIGKGSAYNIKGNYKNILQDKTIEKMQAINTDTHETFEVSMDAANLNFSFNASIGNYRLVFIGKHFIEQTNTFNVPAMNQGSTFIVIPELIGISQNIMANK
jgi:tetratricopeptide (TPR) repeat protein